MIPILWVIMITDIDKILEQADLIGQDFFIGMCADDIIFYRAGRSARIINIQHEKAYGTIKRPLVIIGKIKKKM